MIGLSDNRMKHSLAVARKMKALATSIQDFPYSPEDMFLLGLIHDASYEFVNTQAEHEHLCGILLRDNGYIYWKEVYYHGDPEAPYHSPALSLLNYADMTTDSEGNDVSITMRLDDIKYRYGENSVQFTKALKLSQLLEIPIV